MQTSPTGDAARLSHSPATRPATRAKPERDRRPGSTAVVGRPAAAQMETSITILSWGRRSGPRNGRSHIGEPTDLLLCCTHLSVGCPSNWAALRVRGIDGPGDRAPGQARERSSSSCLHGRRSGRRRGGGFGHRVGGPVGQRARDQRHRPCPSHDLPDHPYRRPLGCASRWKTRATVAPCCALRHRTNSRDAACRWSTNSRPIGEPNGAQPTRSSGSRSLAREVAMCMDTCVAAAYARRDAWSTGVNRREA